MFHKAFKEFVMESTQRQVLEVNVSEIIPASKERAFVAWLDPYDLKCFMMPDDGVSVSAVDNRPAEGGHFLIELCAEGNMLPHRGEYLSIERPNRLVFTWESAFSAPGSVVELSFHGVDQDKTEVRLHHQNFTDEESRQRHEAGWRKILKNLGKYLSK